MDITVKTFEEDEGIKGLGNDPFVSGNYFYTVSHCVSVIQWV